MIDESNQSSKTPQLANHSVMEKLKPADLQAKISPPKKGHGLRKFLIVLAVIILLIVLGLGAVGIYNIPVISSIFNLNKPKDLGVTASPEALASLKEKVPMTITSEKVDYASGDQNIFSGEIAVDSQFTAAEITSWLRRHQSPNPLINNLQLRQFEGGMEISGMVNKYIKAPLYAKIKVDLINSETVNLEFEQGKIGIFNVPQKYLDQAEDFFEDEVNSLITRVPGFSIENYELHDGFSVFQGTFPATVKASPLGWADLLNY